MTDPFLRKRAARCTARRPLSLMLLLAAALAAVLSFSSAAPAQTSLTGRVVKAGEGVADAPVELHRVARDTSGLLARAVTGADGAFTFRVPPADTGGFNVVFATAMVEGVRYFGPALHPGDPGAGYQVVAFDTTSSAGAVDSLRVSRRDVILVAGQRGGWEVAEVVRVDNPLDRTVVGVDGKPVFGLPIPPGATDFQTDDPALSESTGEKPRDLVLMGGRVLATVPLTPGGRDFFFRYRLPPKTGTLSLPLSGRTDTLALYVRQPAPGVSVQGLPAGEPFEAEGEKFVRYTGTSLPADARIRVRWRGHGGAPVDPRLAAGVATALVLAAGAWFALRRRPSSTPA